MKWINEIIIYSALFVVVIGVSDFENKSEKITDSINLVEFFESQQTRTTMNTGDTPYSKCYGENQSCNSYGCSKITVKTPYNSAVLVTIKKGGVVVRHAYIEANDYYEFEVPNGTYQPFFYYGKNWNPNKLMKKDATCGDLKGGFSSEESFGKDTPQYLDNNVLSYELILQKNGNFSTKPSNKNEAL